MKSDVIIIAGYPGTGSSTVAKLLSEHFKFEYVYAGGIMRAMAKERGQSIDDFLVDVLKTPEIDHQLEKRLLARVKKGNAIIESRTMPWMAKGDNIYKIWLTCERPEQIRRMKLRGPEGEAEAKRIDERERVERDRFQQLYGFDMADLSVFDQVIDTTTVPATEVAERIIQDIEA